jgi:hypothetical protein
MKHRARLQAALEHRQPDKIPVDFGSTAVTGIHALAVEQLRDHYGLEKRPVKVWEPYQFLGEVEPDLAAVMGIDTVGIFPPNTIFGFANADWKEFRTPWGQVVLVSKHFQTSPAPDGGLLIYPAGDMSVPASGHMPGTGFFFDTIIRQDPIDDAGLKVEDNLEEFTLISESELDYFKAEARRLQGSDRGVIATFGGTAFGDIALVPGPFLKHPKGIRDVSEWYMSTVTRQDYIHQIFSAQAEIAIKNLGKIHAVVGNLPQAVFVCGTDFGTQDSQFCSTRTFDSLYAPYYKKVNDWIHQHTGWKTFKHCCGAVGKFMDHFIDAGFDIINPVQISARGMDSRMLKDQYGDRLVFWGGGVDTQKTLPFGSPAQVREEVLKQCEIFSHNGGFVFNSVHNIQANVPVENMAAMIDAVKEFNGEK